MLAARRGVPYSLGEETSPLLGAARTAGRHGFHFAAWVAERLRRAGCQVTLWDGEGGPAVVWGQAGEGFHFGFTSVSLRRRSLLSYSHPVVQPPDPLDQWVTPPFEPSVREGKLFARGVSDDSRSRS